MPRRTRRVPAARPLRDAPAAKASALVLAGVLLAGCAQTHPAASTPAMTTAAAAASSATSTVSAGPRSCSEAASRLSVAEQAGLVVLVGLSGAPDADTSALIARDHIGGVVLTGPFATGVAGVKAVTGPLAASGLLVAAAQEGGKQQPLSGAGFDAIPAAAQQAKVAETELRAKWTAWGRQLKDAGVHLNLAPAGDVLSAANAAKKVAPGTWDRLFGSDAEAVAASVTAAVGGLQEAGMAASVAHYPGMGALPAGADSTASGPATDSVTTAASASRAPYRSAASAGADAITISTATFAKIDAANPAVFSSAVMALVREDLRFPGLIVSDDLAGAALAAVPAGERGVRFVRAGGDLALVSDPATADAVVTGLATVAASEQALAARRKEAASDVLVLKSVVGLSGCVAVRG